MAIDYIDSKTAKEIAAELEKAVGYISRQFGIDLKISRTTFNRHTGNAIKLMIDGTHPDPDYENWPKAKKTKKALVDDGIHEEWYNTPLPYMQGTYKYTPGKGSYITNFKPVPNHIFKVINARNTSYNKYIIIKYFEYSKAEFRSVYGFADKDFILKSVVWVLKNPNWKEKYANILALSGHVSDSEESGL